MIGTIVTAGATIGLVFGAFMTWHKAKETLDQIREDAASAHTRFKLDIAHRTSMEEQKRQDVALSDLLSASSDVVAATNIGIHAVYEAGMGLRKANLRFVMVYEVTHKLDQLEEFCTILTQVAKSHFARKNRLGTNPKTLANEGFELLFHSSMALHRGEMDMANFLDGLYNFVDQVKNKHGIILGGAMYIDERSQK